MFAASKGGGDPYVFAQSPGNINEVSYEGWLTLTIHSNGDVTCGGFSGRWWTAGMTPPVCYATYGIRSASAGQPFSGTTLTASPTRVETSTSPQLLCDSWGYAGAVLEVDVAIYSAASGGRLLASFQCNMDVTTP